MDKGRVIDGEPMRHPAFGKSRSVSGFGVSGVDPALETRV